MWEPGMSDVVDTIWTQRCPQNLCSMCVWVCAQLSDFAVTWTEACQACLSMKFSRQEYWIGLPFPTPGVLLPFLAQRLNLCLFHLPHWQADSFQLEPPEMWHAKRTLQMLLSSKSCNGETVSDYMGGPNGLQYPKKRHCLPWWLRR